MGTWANGRIKSVIYHAYSIDNHAQRDASHRWRVGQMGKYFANRTVHPSHTVVRFGCLLYGRPKVENSHAPAAYHFYDSHSESPTYSTYVSTTTTLLNMHGQEDDVDSTVVEIRTVTMWDLICLPTTPRSWMTGRPRMRSYGQFNQQSPPSFDTRALTRHVCVQHVTKASHGVSLLSSLSFKTLDA